MASGKLQHEIGKKKPFESLEEEALLNLLRTNDQTGIVFSRLFRQHGLTSAQYNILRILRGEGKPLPSLEIAQRTVKVVPGITGLIDRLEKLGFVERERSQEDRRVVYVAITKKGLGVLSKIDRPLKAAHESLLGHMTRKEWRQLVRLLEKVRERCETE
jgi:DNA-binding MarR family transcriptional regulator